MTFFTYTTSITQSITQLEAGFYLFRESVSYPRFWLAYYTPPPPGETSVVTTPGNTNPNSFHLPERIIEAAQYR